MRVNIKEEPVDPPVKITKPVDQDSQDASTPVTFAAKMKTVDHNDVWLFYYVIDTVVP